MKKKFTILIAAAFMLLTMMASTGTMWGQSTSSLIFTAECNGSGTADDGAEWTVTSDGTESTYDATKGIHYGTKSAQVQYITLTTSDISGTITSIVVNASVASGVTAALNVTVGGNSFGTQGQSTTTSATNYTFTGSASGEIVVTHTKPESATKALYVKSIVVTYTTGGTPTSNVALTSVDNVDLTATYGSNNTLTEGNNADIDQGASVTLAYANVATGYVFGSWVITKQDDNTNVTADVLSGSTLTVPAYDINISATVSEPQQYTITFNAGSGTCGTASQSYTQGTVITEFPTATPTPGCVAVGYIFDGWSATSVADGSESYTKLTSYTVNGDATLYAVYKLGEDPTPTAFSVGNTGSYAIVSAPQDNKYYALPTNPTVSSGKITAQEITVSEVGGVKYINATDATGFAWTISQATNGYYLNDGSKYIYHSNGGGSGTNLSYGNGTTYTWTFQADGNFVKMKGTNGTTVNNRGMLFNGTTIGGYSLDNWTTSGYYKTMILPIVEASSATYATAPSCTPKVATPVLSIGTGYYAGTQSVTITCETSGAAIYYTLDDTDPTSGSTLYEGAISISETKTLKAIAILDGYDDSEIASATYTILTPLTTMQQIFDAATSTETTVAVTFDNYVISGKATIQAYMTDGTKGCMLYGSGHGFNAGDVLSGTVICKLVLYYGKPEFKELTSSTTGISIATGGTVTPVETTIDAVGLINVGSVVTFNNLTYDGSKLSDGTYTVEPFNGVGYSPSFQNGKTYNVTGVFGYGYGSTDEYKRIFPRSAADIVEVVASTPTIYANPTSLTGFTYSEGNGPSTAQTISVSGTNLEGNITLALNDGEDSAFEISLSENSGYSYTLSLTPSEGTVSATTVYVHMKAGLSKQDDAYEDEINLTSTDATTMNVSLTGAVTGPEVTWNLATASYSSASTTLVTWSSDYVTMTNAKGNSSTNANSYLGGGSNTHTRFYSQQVLSFTPTLGYAISSIEITSTSNTYAGYFTDATWSNATASNSNAIVTVTPTDGNYPVSVTIGSATRATAVKVYYTTSSLTPHNITIDDMENGTVVANPTSAVVGATVTLTIYPAAGYYLDEDDSIEVVGVSGTCSLTKVNAGTFSFEMPDEDVTVYAIFSHYDDTYYTLVNSTADLIPGRHYIIANSKTAGPAQVLGKQNGNFRNAVDADVIGNMIYKTVNVREVVLSGDAYNHWTLYDDTTAYVGVGYLYAEADNHLKARKDNSSDDNHLWSISITEGVATIVSQIEGDDVSNTIKYNYNNGSNPRFSCYKPLSGMSLVYLYMKGNDSNSTYYSPTTVTDLTIESTEIYTVESGQILTVNGTLINTNPANLIIEDGGQLIHDSDNVAATIQRKVNGYDTSKDGDNSGYELIASPVTDTLDVDTETNLTDDGEYDLYIFDQSKAQEEWRNYKKTPNPDFTTIENGKGYLYANSADVTISFSGTLKPSDENVEIVLDYEDGHPFTGWNLVGNPFACNAYAFDTIGKSLAFYKMNAAGDDFEATTGPIAPMEGIFVYASATGKTFEFTRTAPASVPGKGNLNLEIAQVVTSRDAHKATDNAIIRFDGGSTLEKFSFSENNAKIYFPQNGKDYAVVSAEAQGEMPVYFKAAENGTYTISFSMDNVEFGYLHLIDNKTGNDVDLLQTPSYTFVASTIDYASRFRLVFRATGNDNDSENNDFGFFDANGNFLVLGIEGTATLQVMDVTGRILSTETFSGDYSKAINAKAGVYMLRLIQGSDVRTQKVVVK